MQYSPMDLNLQCILWLLGTRLFEGHSRAILWSYEILRDKQPMMCVSCGFMYVKY